MSVEEECFVWLGGTLEKPRFRERLIYKNRIIYEKDSYKDLNIERSLLFTSR